MPAIKKELINYINMENDNNNIDLDDFWAELISKSEWAKNSALKTPSEFKNLNILGSKKKNIAPTTVSVENKIVKSQVVAVSNPKKLILLIILKIILVIALVCLLVTALLVTYTLLGGHFNIWDFRFG